MRENGRIAPLRHPESHMLLGYVSDEFYAALATVSLEFRSVNGGPARWWTASLVSAAVYEPSLPPGDYEVCLSKPGFGAKRVRARLGSGIPVQFRLLSDRLLGY